METVTDQFARPLTDLRISVTDRCNLRCTYCMPREVFGPGFAFLPREELLTFEEITALARAFVACGVTKIRLTGGEPLLRQDVAELVRMLAALDGLTDLALTTNGLLLPSAAAPLREAGLHRVTVSLDALDDTTFGSISDTNRTVADVLAGIDAAVAAGFPPPKINTVIRGGTNEHAIVELARYGRETGTTVRFIEFMDVGHTNRWSRDQVVAADDILARIAAHWELDPVVDADGNAVAERYRYRDGSGEVGVIASVTRPFCRTCVRARLSAVGELFTCLFASQGTDLRAVVRAGADHEQLTARVAGVWSGRTDRYSELRGLRREADPSRVEMSYIGG